MDAIIIRFQEPNIVRIIVLCAKIRSYRFWAPANDRLRALSNVIDAYC